MFFGAERDQACQRIGLARRGGGQRIQQRDPGIGRGGGKRVELGEDAPHTGVERKRRLKKQRQALIGQGARGRSRLVYQGAVPGLEPGPRLSKGGIGCGAPFRSRRRKPTGFSHGGPQLAGERRADMNPLDLDPLAEIMVEEDEGPYRSQDPGRYEPEQVAAGGAKGPA